SILVPWSAAERNGHIHEKCGRNIKSSARIAAKAFKHAQGGRQASSLIASVSVDCICIQLSAFVGLGVCFFSV
ncbi:hypothetical protein, partial [Ruthenibacterium lactatiformans]